jgi:hypothetical protein
MCIFAPIEGPPAGSFAAFVIPAIEPAGIVVSVFFLIQNTQNPEMHLCRATESNDMVTVVAGKLDLVSRHSFLDVDCRADADPPELLRLILSVRVVHVESHIASSDTLRFPCVGGDFDELRYCEISILQSLVRVSSLGAVDCKLDDASLLFAEPMRARDSSAMFSRSSLLCANVSKSALIVPARRLGSLGVIEEFGIVVVLGLEPVTCRTAQWPYCRSVPTMRNSVPTQPDTSLSGIVTISMRVSGLRIWNALCGDISDIRTLRSSLYQRDTKMSSL